MKKIQSPEGVAMLLENIWLRHKTDIKQSSQNVYMVELPPLRKNEREECRNKTLDSKNFTLKELLEILSQRPAIRSL